VEYTKLTRIVIPLLAIAVVVSLSCGLIDQGDPATSIRGVVTDSVTGEPIDSALLQIADTLNTLPVYSDSLGRYTIAHMGYGTYRVFCRKEGYHMETRVVRSWKDNTMITGVNFQLSPE
jgi:hypothetical protein